MKEKIFYHNETLDDLVVLPLNLDKKLSFQLKQASKLVFSHLSKAKIERKHN